MARLSVCRARLVVFLTALILTGCGKASPTAPSPAPVPSGSTPAPTAPTASTPIELLVSGITAGNVGQVAELIATARLSNGAAQNVTAQATWQSSNDGVATVSSSGQLTVTGLGVVDVRAAYQGLTAVLSFTVLPLATETPTYTPYRSLMPQVSGTGPLYVTAGPTVNGTALTAAGSMLRTMLVNRFDVAAAMRAAGALTAVFGRDETSCNLPFFADLIGTASCTTGGLSGVPGRPATACAERNLLSLPNDPYFRGRSNGENVCVHELAHTIMNVGLSNQDRVRIRARFDEAKVEGKWTGDFAMENDNEFFAEMSQAYFCANPEIPTFLHTHGINCAERLRAYDAASYALIHGIFRGAADLR